MKRSIPILLLFILFGQMVFCQSPSTFTIHKKPVIKVLNSRSNCLYMGITNHIKLLNVDSTDNHYWIISDYGYAKKIKPNRFNVYALRPTPTKLVLYSRSGYDSIALDTLRCNVREAPLPKLGLAGKPLQYTVSDSLLRTVKRLEVVFSDTDLISAQSWMHVTAFAMRIMGRTYSSETDMLTDEMIKALNGQVGQKIDFINIEVTGDPKIERLNDLTWIILAK